MFQCHLKKHDCNVVRISSDQIKRRTTCVIPTPDHSSQEEMGRLKGWASVLLQAPKVSGVDIQYNYTLIQGCTLTEHICPGSILRDPQR